MELIKGKVIKTLLMWPKFFQNIIVPLNNYVEME